MVATKDTPGDFGISEGSPVTGTVALVVPLLDCAIISVCCTVVWLDCAAVCFVVCITIDVTTSVMLTLVVLLSPAVTMVIMLIPNTISIINAFVLIVYSPFHLYLNSDKLTADHSYLWKK